jgi:hypothetical protein
MVMLFLLFFNCVFLANLFVTETEIGFHILGVIIGGILSWV